MILLSKLYIPLKKTMTFACFSGI